MMGGLHDGWGGGQARDRPPPYPETLHFILFPYLLRGHALDIARLVTFNYPIKPALIAHYLRPFCSSRANGFDGKALLYKDIT